MIILPAIDLHDGSCVRLMQGDYATAEKVAESPVKAASYFESEGAHWLHMVDLDGAKDGVRKNGDIVRDVCQRSGMKVELGGGIRSMEDLAALSDRILVLSEGRLFRLGTPAEVFADAAALKAVGLGAPAPEAFAASLREVGFTLGRDLYDERTLAADIAAQLAGTPVAAAPDAAVGFAALRAADAVAEGGGDDA